MKRTLITFCFALSLAIPLFAGDLTPIEGDSPEKLLGSAENLKIVTGAKEVTVYRIATDAGQPEDRKSINIDGLKCTASTSVSGPEQQKAVAALSDVTNFGQPAKCDFDPGIIIRFKNDAGAVDVLVCFHCGEMEIYRDGKLVTRTLKDAGTKNSFGKDATTAFIILAKKAFPDDPDIKALPAPALSTVDMITSLETAGEEYYDQTHALPETPENYKVVAALLGNNADKRVYIEFNKNQISANGEVLDEWGTPFRFNFSQDQSRPIQAVSAGKDKIFGTADDVPKLPAP